jgi:arylsulfatase A-like enzyme
MRVFCLIISLGVMHLSAAAQPNVVLIMTDDQGYGDVAYHGNPDVTTPNLDQLAAEGVRLTNCHASPYCVPARAALMTGRFASRTGIHTHLYRNHVLAPEENTIAEVFSENGYSTAMFGKWHLGDFYPFRPRDMGFQKVLKHGHGAIGHIVDYWDNSYADATYLHDGVEEQIDGFCTDIFSMLGHAAESILSYGKNTSKTYFLEVRALSYKHFVPY